MFVGFRDRSLIYHCIEKGFLIWCPRCGQILIVVHDQRVSLEADNNRSLKISVKSLPVVPTDYINV